MSVTKRVAAVTGASSGIGRAVALGLAAEGYHVAVIARRKEQLEETAALAGAAASRMLAVPGDVSDPASVKASFDRVAAAFGRLDLLFNNAGVVLRATPLEDISPEDWRKVIDINLNGSFYCAQAAVRIMKQQDPKGGRIINNGSISALVPRLRGIAYTASKHAITGLTKSISLEGRDYDISCCQINLGNATIERTAQMEKGMLQPDGTMKPEPRMSIDSIVKSILFMASLPLTESVPNLTIMPNKMPFLGRG
ncbi:oxidoreductase [Deltaproteobacteria bacterium]|nr:oxidoreductase [Deltaproteobacteria bacterium]